MILGIAAMVVANLAAWFAATAAFRRLRTGTEIDWPLFLAIRLGVISLAVVAAGLTGTLTAPVLMAGGVVLIVILHFSRSLHLLPSLPRIEAGRIVAVLAALLALRLLVQALLLSPHVPDALTYHLPKIAEWIRAGGFTREMGADPRASFPAGFELVEAWWVVFLRNDVLIELAGIEFLILAAAAVHALARTMGLSSRSASFAAVLAALTPGLHLQATSGLNDGAAASVVLTAMAFVAARAPWPLLAGVAGLGVGIKPTFALAIPGILLLAWLARKEPREAPPSPRSALAFAAAGTLLGVLWYARNLVWYGNPLHPMGPGGILGPTGRAAQQFGPRLSSLQENLLCLFDIRVRDDLLPYGSMCDSVAGWGAVAFACGIPGLLLAVRSDARWRRLFLGFAAALAGVLVFVQLDRWFPRFVLFFPALLALAAARLGESCKGALLLCAAAVLLEFAGTCVPKEWHERPVLPADLSLAKGEPAGCYGDMIGMSYLLYDRDYSRPVLYLRSETPEKLIEEVRSRGLRLLFAAPDRRREQDILSEAARLGGWRRVHTFFYFPP